MRDIWLMGVVAVSSLFYSGPVSAAAASYQQDDPGDSFSREGIISDALNQAEAAKAQARKARRYNRDRSPGDSSPTRIFDDPGITPPDAYRVEEDPFLREQKEKENALPVHPSHRQQVVHKALDEFDIKLDLHTGFRLDKFNYDIAGNMGGGSPNILSELIWDKLKIYEVGTKADVLWKQLFLMEAEVNYGWIFDGEHEDRDFSGNNRGGEFSNSHSATEDDNTFNASLGFGLQFAPQIPEGWRDFLTDDPQIALLGGYARHELNLRDTEGFQDIPPTGSFSGLNSTSEIKWKGPWSGVEFRGRRNKFSGYSRFEYHWARYQNKSNWNLRTDLQHPVSFYDVAKGRGIILACGGEYSYNDDWSFGLDLEFQDWETDAGIARTFAANNTISETRLNIAEWRSYALMASAQYRFSSLWPFAKRANQEER